MFPISPLSAFIGASSPRPDLVGGLGGGGHTPLAKGGHPGILQEDPPEVHLRRAVVLPVAGCGALADRLVSSCAGLAMRQLFYFIWGLGLCRLGGMHACFRACV